MRQHRCYNVPTASLGSGQLYSDVEIDDKRDSGGVAINKRNKPVTIHAFDPDISISTRRRFLQVLAGGAAVCGPGWVRVANGLWLPDETLMPTPAQTEGPFYPETPIEQQLFNDTNLYQKDSGHEFAKGQPIVVSGDVKDRRGKPLLGAIVEIWQACASGRYLHSRDRNENSLLDNNFQFWGRAITGEDGRYAFKTILPGLYPGRMARHIHFRIDAPEFQRLTTQCYFTEFGEDNARDGLYQRLDSQQRELVSVELDKPSDQAEPWSGSFPIVLS
jgi:protocatechuate 3,4-dioxygenase, beta subunit